MMNAIPEYVPQNLRDHYRPPHPVADAQFFRTREYDLYPIDQGGLRTRDWPERTVKLPESAVQWAELELRRTGDTRWTEYLAHQQEQHPSVSREPDWLTAMRAECVKWAKATRSCATFEAERVATAVHSAVVVALAQDYDRRHMGMHPHRHAFEREVVEKAEQCTDEDLTRLWWDYYGHPQAEARRTAAVRAEARAERAAAIEREVASAHRQASHEQMEAEAAARQAALGDELEARALARLEAGVHEGDPLGTD